MCEREGERESVRERESKREKIEEEKWYTRNYYTKEGHEIIT